MSRAHVCQHGNCESTETPIAVSTATGRPKFCSELHAALFLIGQVRRALRSTGDPHYEGELIAQAEIALEEIDRQRTNRASEAGA